MLTDRELIRRVDRLAGSVDEARWELAKLASEARDSGIREYAEIIGRHEKVRRSSWTVRHWARVYDFRRHIDRDIKLPFSSWEVAAHYEKRVPKDDLVEMMESFAFEAGASAEMLRKELEALSGDPEIPEWQDILKKILPSLKRLVECAPENIRRAAIQLISPTAK